MCRVAETATTQVRNLDFVEAARATGAGHLMIVRHHLLGNVLAPVLVYASSLVSVSILLASGLSFLGLGVRPPIPDWGLMLSTLRQAIYVQALGVRGSGGGDIPDQHVLQPGERWVAVGDGCAAEMSAALTQGEDRGGPGQPMLIASDLRKYFAIAGGGKVRAVDGISFTVGKGETLGVVGESGCGKSTLARLLLHLIVPDAGELVFDGEAVGEASGILLKDLRRQAQMVFQDSASSLNPRMPVRDSVAFGPLGAGADAAGGGGGGG